MRRERLRQMRELRGYTQEELSHLLGMGEKEIWRYENGKSTPSADKMADIAKLLKVTTDYLLGLSDDPTTQLRQSDLQPIERQVISAWRLGDKLQAIKAIVGDE